ncbi:hypothetical protein WBG78_27320 [Chryseolinea sp. T2]|uniref:hypothetical protein n=1 Tax=Chryseolinea sp. T2 TaxID=3129255 RepID=UPI0030787738
MPKAVNNNVLNGVSGKLGNNIVIRQSKLGTVVANKPKKTTKPPSATQLAVRDKFSDAAYYAREQMKVPEALAMYQAAITPRLTSPYSVAISDFLTKPRIRGIDARQYRGAVGDVIKARASDDFRVASVWIVIKSATGSELESGEASLVAGSLQPEWVYTAKVVNASLAGTSITATAKDIPGNEVSDTVTV